MPLDHYVSQVHLKQFFSLALGSRLYATKKSDLKSFQCHSKDVCRIEDGSTNAYLINDRAIEEFLRGIESLSGHIPRSLLRASDMMPFCHQYPAACCGDFLFGLIVSTGFTRVHQ